MHNTTARGDYHHHHVAHDIYIDTVNPNIITLLQPHQKVHTSKDAQRQSKQILGGLVDCP